MDADDYGGGDNAANLDYEPAKAAKALLQLSTTQQAAFDTALIMVIGFIQCSKDHYLLLYWPPLTLVDCYGWL